MNDKQQHAINKMLKLIATSVAECLDSKRAQLVYTYINNKNDQLTAISVVNCALNAIEIHLNSVFGVADCDEDAFYKKHLRCYFAKYIAQAIIRIAKDNTSLIAASLSELENIIATHLNSNLRDVITLITTSLDKSHNSIKNKMQEINDLAKDFKKNHSAFYIVSSLLATFIQQANKDLSHEYVSDFFGHLESLGIDDGNDFIVKLYKTHIARDVTASVNCVFIKYIDNFLQKPKNLIKKDRKKDNKYKNIMSFLLSHHLLLAIQAEDNRYLEILVNGNPISGDDFDLLCCRKIINNKLKSIVAASMINAAIDDDMHYNS